MAKRVHDMRGPELVHNQLIHKQYGIIALSGGQMEFGHFDMIRNSVNRKLDMTKTFAVWRVDSPWKPITKHYFSILFWVNKNYIFVKISY